MPIARPRVLAIAAAGCIFCADARAATVWTALAAEKIRADAPARVQQTAAIAAARNEFEAFQVIVTGPASAVSAQISDFSGPGTISGAKLYREDLINVTIPSSPDGATGLIPDALVPDVDDVVGEQRNAFPFDVPAGQSRGIWAELLVPRNAAPGTYHARVLVQTAEGETIIPVTLEVWDFTLPSTASLKTAFEMAYGGLVHQHGVTGDALTQLRQRYAQLALDHRVTLSNLWDDGRAGDWSHFDRAYGPFLDGFAPTRLEGARLTAIESGANLSSASDLADWAAHFRERGWFRQLYQFICDEPPRTCTWADVALRAQNTKQADPDFRTLVTTSIDRATANKVDGFIDIMAAIINSFEDANATAGQPLPEYADFLASAPLKELWLYESCSSHGCGGLGNVTGWPSYVIDSSAVRARAMGWLAFQYGATGESYYETTQAYYNEDPWTDQREFAGTGDGTLFYPGTVSRIGGQTDIPIASIRLKMIREGLEDYEYLKMLSDLGQPGEAKKIAWQLFPHPRQTDQAPEALMAARDALARQIVALASKSPGGAGSLPSPERLAGSSSGCGKGSLAGPSAIGLAPIGVLLLCLRRLASRCALEAREGHAKQARATARRPAGPPAEPR